MHKVVIHELAQESLRKLFLKDRKSFNKISIALDELEKNGLKLSGIKNYQVLIKFFAKELVILEFYLLLA